VSTDSLLETEWTEPGSPITSFRVLLWIGLAVLLVAELVTLTLPFVPPGTLTEKGFWAGVLFAGQRGIRPTFITAGTATIFLSWPVLHQEFRRVLDESPNQFISVRWLAAHLTLLGVLIFRNSSTRYSSKLDGRLGRLAFFFGAFLACGALVTWLFSALPPRFWVRWLGPKPPGVSGSRSGRPRCICAWQLDARIVVAAAALDLSDSGGDPANVRSSGGGSSR